MSDAASYLTLKAGTPVHDCLDARVGEVRRVLTHKGGHFDGILITTPAGRRFVDAHEVRNTSTQRVELSVTREEVEDGDPTRPNAPRTRSSALRRILGRPDRIPVARWDKTDASDADREAAVRVLKRAYIEDRISDEQLGDLVGQAHDARTVAELDALVQGFAVSPR